jgi:hypothetical protein
MWLILYEQWFVTHASLRFYFYKRQRSRLSKVVCSFTVCIFLLCFRYAKLFCTWSFGPIRIWAKGTIIRLYYEKIFFILKSYHGSVDAWKLFVIYEQWYDFTMKNICFVLVDMSYMLWILCEAKTLYFAYVIIWSYVLYRLQLKTYVHKLFPMSSLHLGGSLPTWYVRGSISSAKMKLQYNYNGSDHKDDEHTRRD